MIFARPADVSANHERSERSTVAALPAPLHASPPAWVWNALVLAGIACRVVQYLWDRSFWVDEASLVLNIRERTAALLMGALDFNQAAAPLFLLAQRGFYRAFGGSELSLRLLPLIAGCVSVILFCVLARRMLKPWAAVVALALFCFSDRLIWHATEAKPYGTDVCVAIVLTLVAVAGRSDVRNLVALCALAAVAVWFSFPAVLVFAGISLAFLPSMTRRRVRGIVIYVLYNVPVVLSFLALMWVVRAQHNESLAEYWAEDFLPLHEAATIGLWLGRRLFALCNYAAEPLGFLTLPCVIIGAIWMLRNRQLRTLAMLVNPMAMNLLAAAAQRFPFDGSRVTTYLTPAVLLLSGAGAVAIVDWAGTRAKKLAILPAAAMVVVAASLAAYSLVIPRDRGHIRPAAEFVRQHAGPDDTIYALLYREFECYWPENDPRVQTELPPADQIPTKRFWIVWSFPNNRVLHRLDGTLKWAGSFATRKLTFVGHGGSAYLFEIEKPPPNVEPPDMSTHHKMMDQ